MRELVRNAYRLIVRAISPNSGLTRLSFNGPVNYLFASAPKTMIATMRDGLPIEIDPQDYHGRILWLFGSNDLKVSRTVNALLRPGEVLLDIGANHGTIGFSARHAVGPGGRIHLFEPQPHLIERLRKAAMDRTAPNVSVHGVGLFDADGEMELIIPEHHSGMATLMPSTVANGTSGWGRLSVPIRATESYVAPLVGERSFGVKIDIEGAEPAVLRELFRFAGLKFVVFEGDRNEEFLFNEFHRAGFEIYGLKRSLLIPKVVLVDDLVRWHDFHDFVAVKLTAVDQKREIGLPRLAKLRAK